MNTRTNYCTAKKPLIYSPHVSKETKYSEVAQRQSNWLWHSLKVMLIYMTEKRTYADRAEYLKKAVAKRRRKIREMSINYLGGCCAICGYDRCHQALDFHHKEPTKKSFGISQKGYTRSWKRVQEELDKCFLICANCHREIHAGITQLPMETLE